MMYIYMNGEFLLENEIKISPFDHGFLYGLGVFETFRTYDGHPFLLDDHFHRLENSAKQLNIHMPISKNTLKSVIKQLLDKNELTNAYIRVNLSAGVAPVGLTTKKYETPNLIIFIQQIVGDYPKQKDAKILHIRRNSPEGEYRLKSHHYLNNILAKRELGDATIEGIFLTEEGYVAEGIVSNIFWVKNGQVYTPKIETGILNGITRQFTIEMLKMLSIPCFQGFYYLEAVFVADEVFITNSVQEIVSVRKINEHVYETNSLTHFLQQKYKELITKRLNTFSELNGKEE